MKVVCTTGEYANLIRDCEHGDCGECAFRRVCGEEMLEDAVQFEIVDE